MAERLRMSMLIGALKCKWFLRMKHLINRLVKTLGRLSTLATKKVHQTTKNRQPRHATPLTNPKPVSRLPMPKYFKPRLHPPYSTPPKTSPCTQTKICSQRPLSTMACDQLQHLRAWHSSSTTWKPSRHSRRIWSTWCLKNRIFCWVSR